MSTFVGKGKKTAWQAWNVFGNTTEVCHCLSSLCGNLPENEISVYKEFNVIMYGRSTSTNKVNETLLDLLARKQRPYNGIPPSKAALIMTYMGAIAMQVGNYHHHPVGVGTKLSEFGSQTGHNWHQ